MHDKLEKCGIRQAEMFKFSAVNSIQMVCCNDDIWYHRKCLKSTAFAFTDDFDCPSCGNQEEFQNNMALNGIYIPKSDYLPNYFSQTDADIDDEEEDGSTQMSKRRRTHKNWVLENTFPNKKKRFMRLPWKSAGHTIRLNLAKKRLQNIQPINL